MATCKENCIHYSVCGLWDRKVLVDYEKDILSDFSDLPNVEEYCRNYFSKQVEAEWTTRRYTTENDWGIINHREEVCGNCNKWQKERTNFCCHCGAKMKGVE
jgi:hypothetical protein